MSANPPPTAQAAGARKAHIVVAICLASAACFVGAFWVALEQPNLGVSIGYGPTMEKYGPALYVSPTPAEPPGIAYGILPSREETETLCIYILREHVRRLDSIIERIDAVVDAQSTNAKPSGGTNDHEQHP